MSGKRRPPGRASWVRQVDREQPELIDAALLIARTPAWRVPDWLEESACMGVELGELLRQRDRLIELGYAVAYPDGGVSHAARPSRKAERNDAAVPTDN